MLIVLLRTSLVIGNTVIKCLESICGNSYRKMKITDVVDRRSKKKLASPVILNESMFVLYLAF